jgi:hypothetical protein
MKQNILAILMLVFSAIACGSSNGVELYTGPEIKAGSISISVTGNLSGEVVLSSQYSHSLIGTDDLGINWVVGFSKTLKKAESTSYYLYVLWESASGSIYRDTYEVGEPFKVKFQKTEWVRELNTDNNGNVIVAVERNKIIEYYSSSSSDPNSNSSDSNSVSRDTYYPLSSCAGSRLMVGDRAMISLTGGKNAIRSNPDTHPSNNIIGYAQPGDYLKVVGGPECNYGWILWKVRLEKDNLEGWTPESKDGVTFWVEFVDK